MRVFAIVTGLLLAGLSVPALAHDVVHGTGHEAGHETGHNIVEPQLHIAKGGVERPQVALTLDACSGKTDRRILDVLLKERIPATIFVTGRWIKGNSEAMAILTANQDLFQIENHGAMHVPAITTMPTMYGIKTAGTVGAVREEVEGGASAINAAGGRKTRWYRDATARYSKDAIRLVEDMGYRIGGYSLNGDMGASLAAAAAEKRVAGARDGDVIIAHINQPGRSAGAGVAKGILALKQKNVRFVRLNDVEAHITSNPVSAHELNEERSAASQAANNTAPKDEPQKDQATSDRIKKDKLQE